MTKKRLYGLDLLRIICALVIYFFHSILHMGHNYGLLSPFFKEGPIFMVLFFMISGFTLHYQYHSTTLMHMDNLKPFYIKKAADLIPLYWLLVLIYEPIYQTLTWKRQLFLLPTELLGQQSIYDQINSYTHNSGSWFISCLIFCIFFSPFFNDLISQLSTKMKISILSVLCFLCIYGQILVKVYTTYLLYSNVVFRLFEYVIGMLVCSLYLETKQRENNLYLLPALVSFSTLILSVTTLHNGKLGNYHIYNFVVIPCSLLILWCSLFINFKTGTILTAIISHLNRLVYPFYIAQFFVWKIIQFILDRLPFDLPNYLDIVITLITCYLLSLTMYHTVCIPCKKIILRKFK